MRHKKYRFIEYLGNPGGVCRGGHWPRGWHFHALKAESFRDSSPR